MAMGGTVNSQLVQGLGALRRVGPVLVAANAVNQAVPHGLVDHAGNSIVPGIIIPVAIDAGGEQVRIGTTPATSANIYLSSANAAAKNVYVYVG